MFLGTEVLKKMVKEGVMARIAPDGSQKSPNEGDNAVFDKEKGAWLYPLVDKLPEDHDFKGCSIDLRLGELYEHLGGAELYEDKRNTGNVVKIEPDADNFYHMEPGKVYLASTIEVINMPSNLTGIVLNRSTLYRSGINLKSGFVNPSYFGQMPALISNLASQTSKIQRGYRIMSVAFAEAKGENSPYTGRWQGGKMHTNGEFDVEKDE